MIFLFFLLRSGPWKFFKILKKYFLKNHVFLDRFAVRVPLISGKILHNFSHNLYAPRDIIKIQTFHKFIFLKWFFYFLWLFWTNFFKSIFFNFKISLIFPPRDFSNIEDFAGPGNAMITPVCVFLAPAFYSPPIKNSHYG